MLFYAFYSIFPIKWPTGRVVLKQQNRQKIPLLLDDFRPRSYQYLLAWTPMVVPLHYLLFFDRRAAVTIVLFYCLSHTTSTYITITCWHNTVIPDEIESTLISLNILVRLYAINIGSFIIF